MCEVRVHGCCCGDSVFDSSCEMLWCYAAGEAHPLREQQLRKAGQERLVLNDAMFHAASCGVRHVPSPWPRRWWTPPPAAGNKRGCF